MVLERWCRPPSAIALGGAGGISRDDCEYGELLSDLGFGQSRTYLPVVPSDLAEFPL